MMARCAPRLIRPLLNGLNMGKVQSFQYLRVAEHSQVPASPQPERSFSSTHRLHDVPRDTGIPAQGQTPEAVWRLQGSANPSVSSVDRVTVHFINRDGERLTATAKEGESLLEVVVNQNLGIDGFGACEGTLACSTCHLIFEEDVFQKLDTITDEELDMLDLAYGLTDTSRLGCQVCVKKAMDGLTVQVPVEVADMRRELEVEKQSK